MRHSAKHLAQQVAESECVEAQRFQTCPPIALVIKTEMQNLDYIFSSERILSPTRVHLSAQALRLFGMRHASPARETLNTWIV